jgi:ferredoxin
MPENNQPAGKKVVKVVIDKSTCIGCGTCVVLAGKAFGMGNDGYSQLLDTWQEEEPQKIINTAKACPVGAVSVFDEEGNLLN